MDEQERSAYLDAFGLLECRMRNDFEAFNEMLGMIATNTVSLCSVINAMTDMLATEIQVTYAGNAEQTLAMMRAKILRDESDPDG